MSDSDDDHPRFKPRMQAIDASKPSFRQASPVNSPRKQRLSPKTSLNKDILVYIPDLPSNLPEDEMEQMIQTRIEATQRMTVTDVKCYLKLGAAVIQLMNEADKNHLVSTVQSMVLDIKQNINISFVDEIDLDSYIVLDRKMSKIPSSDEVARCYAQAYNTRELYACEPISVQFPNIFRIYLKTLDELIEVAKTPDFRIENTSANVYTRADCSFFEDLPRNTNDDKLSAAISVQSGLPPTSFYVQHNKHSDNAVVLASKSAKKWIIEGYLIIDGRKLSKKANLAYRVLVSPVPREVDLNRILYHKLFAKRVVSHKHIDDSLILELDNIDNYNNCLEIGAVRIDNNTMIITPHTAVSNLDSSEIDAVNWYETAMLDIKPDITTIINNHQHPIFHYKWNAQNWIEQMKKAEAMDRNSKKYDLNGHLLRVTVMLNTIGVLRKKKYVVDDEEVILKSERIRTIGYDHKAKLSHGKKISQTEMKTPYSSTTVKVINEDCLVLYEKLVAEGHRPVLLNMANAASPGGGYRKGDGAQEENLFRRSDYYHSLDAELADIDRSEQFYCTPKCELKPLRGSAGFYPMEEFGAIYTSGITVFRQTEAKGYAYMKNPLYNVCAIAMAAYRDPPLNNKNMLENKSAINTHRKIENIFAIAHQHKHDCLVLSAFGCGAFKNPPEHVALLFKSVIYQYAGYFKNIYFAIIDDHNTGNRINPQGNLRPFERLLDGLIVEPPKTLRVNGISGPHRILDKTSDGQITLSDVCISYLPPCQHGSKCHDLKNPQHNNEFSHPPMCSLQDTKSSCDQMNDEVHMFTFLHKTKCKHGGECTSKDPTHLSEYDHPDYCKDESRCIDIRPEHLSAYRHLPVCDAGVDCPKYLRGEPPDHCNSFRHCKSICAHDNCCVNFHDKKHMNNAIHSFRTPCSFTPYSCSMYVKFVQTGDAKEINGEVENHCLKYSHVCPFGRLCKTKDERHFETSIHIARQLCPDLDKCSKRTQEDHLESFSHPDIRDIRLFCKFPGFECRQRFDNEHLRRFRHGKNHNHLSVAPSSNLNSHINFVQNQRQLIKNVNNYVDTSKWKKATISPEILNWIRASQPVHRCGKLIFESILVHGHVMSRHYMKLLEKPKYVTKAVLQHSRVRLIFLKHNNPAVKENASKLIKALVEAEFAKTGADGITSLKPDHEEHINVAKTRLKTSLHDTDLKIIYDWTVRIAQASIKLHGAPMGIGFDVDEKLGTDKHIFSIVGLHLGYYYGDIIITFKQEIMFHPDANFTVQAGTSFNSGRTYKNRPWSKDPGTQDKRVEDFHRSKLHCSVPRYEYAAATELAALSGINKHSMDVDLDSVIKRWMAVDSHDVFEGHLPQLIPLDYIDKVYMPKNVFESLTHEAQQSARGAFKDSLIITEHVIDLSLIKPGATIPLDSTRIPYQKFVLEKLSETIKQRISTPQISRGIVITVPGSKFEEHIVLPMTISQSYDLYRLDKTQAPEHPGSTYIYWQAMNGDMMLTISNEKIEPDKDQPDLRCLVCYVAGKPSTANEDYHEEYSYLNDGHPYQHYSNVHTAKFRAKSNLFYRGCNTDDFFTFCLKISHKTGEVTLSHAGPNGIYNHEKIHYQFNKSDLDLSRIGYIHVSGGTQDVPIRNLTINHEQVPRLHPSFDKDFKIDTSELLRKRRASIDHITRAPYHGGAPNHKPAPQPRRPRPASVEPAPRAEKPSLLGKIKNAFFGSPAKDTPPVLKASSSTGAKSNPRRVESPPSHRSRAGSSPSNRAGDKPSRASSPPRASSKLTPCRDSVYCLHQKSKDHYEKYSHPCRFNELCRNQANEPHLVHERHNVSKCSKDQDCLELNDPVHRAKYRHTNLPDYLTPCHYQDTCYDKSPEHRIKFFHGEELPSIKKNKTLANAHYGGAARTHLIPCQYGTDCRSMKNSQHLAKYSHPTS